MNSIFVLDIDPERAELVCSLLREHGIETKQSNSFSEIRQFAGSSAVFLVAHCALINYSFTELAILRNHPHVRLMIYCTQAEHKSSDCVLMLPQELSKLLNQFANSHRKAC